MTTTPQAILRIDPKKIKPDPTNPRKKLRNIDELADNVRQNGVLQAITVRPGDKEGEYIIVMGARRHAAALKARVPDMPAVLDGATDDRTIAMQRMVENVQRDDLTAIEHAAGVQGLFDLGHSEDDIALGLSVPLERVKVARTVATSKAVAVIDKKHELTFDQAAAFAEFEDHKDIVKDLTRILVERPSQFTQTAERYRKHLAEALMIAEEAVRWTEKGYRILSEQDTWHGTKFVGLRRLRKSKDAKTQLTSAELATNEGRAVVIGTNFAGTKVEVEEGCVDPAKHGLVDAWGGASRQGDAAGAPKTEKAKEAETVKRRTHLAALAAGRAAEGPRRAFVRSLLLRKTSPRGTDRFVTETLLLRYQRIESPTELFSDLTGMRQGVQAKEGSPQERYAKMLTDKNILLGLVAHCAAGVESDWAPNTWDNGSEHRKRYLNFLMACGYEPSVVELTLIGKAKPADVLAESERIKAAAKLSKSTAPKQAAPKKAAPAKKAAKRRAPARRRRS